VWSLGLSVGLLIIIAGVVGCGSGASVAGPSSVSDIETPAPVPQLAPPPVLRGRWATGDKAALVPPSDNIVVLTPSYAEDEPEAIARALAARRLPVIVFAGHIYCGSPSTWPAAWASFDRYLEPFRMAGVLVGIQPLDEPLLTGYGDKVAAAHADAKARGYRVLATEWADQVWGPYSSRRPANTDWWAITCYPYPGTKWTSARCGERLTDARDVDVLAAIHGHGYDSAAWIAEATSRGKGFLVWEEDVSASVTGFKGKP
jgi:hypothetical protein